MRIGILQTGDAPPEIVPDTGDYPDMFMRLLADRGFTFRTWRVLDGDFPTDVHQADGWLITGSKFGVYEDHAFLPPLRTFIRDAYAARVPMVGICFGHQIIAQALGGVVEKFAGGWSIGRTEYRFGDETLSMNAWHQDQVTTRPEGAEVIGQSDFCANAALIYDDRALTVQAHPEFDDTVVRGLLVSREDVVPTEDLDRARRSLGQPNDAARIATQIADFFHKPR
ncbi:type 1 glutamine amidotransferase [Falsirhodobacter halotolerans]|uniref:type 1 glutamine amidotransferase n=1 Tax=Falsirhodobacter halotolerans TaxID=1146892 RepID=UPI001FD14CCE|nr:type 1 glutamine amidotransferase [Falsirhodobacter halotolerans]MCJ8140292.1 type 1 glutamine amidotransferase [Falsirhodobacter halotolerans]